MAASKNDPSIYPGTFSEWEVLVGEYKFPVLRAKGWTTEVDVNGCRFLSDETIGPGEQVRMVMLAGRKVMCLKGLVVKNCCLGDGEFQIDVDFSELSDRNFNIISSATVGNC